MQFIVEFKSFYKNGDIVLIEYWYNDMITPVKIIEQISTRTFKVSHNIEQSKISNAPDEIIKTSDIIDKFKLNSL
jgi:hypothetical protein